MVDGMTPSSGAGRAGPGAPPDKGTPLQPASIPTMAASPRKRFMLLILLEALLALLVLGAIVWWTMFSGRPKGELPPDARAEQHNDRPDDA
jgi:hypothetical protein